MTNRISAAFAVHCADGNRILPAVGVVAVLARQNITKAVVGNGTHSTRAGVAPAANINGTGRLVYGAIIIHCMKPGTPTNKIELHRLRRYTVSQTMRATFPARGLQQ